MTTKKVLEINEQSLVDKVTGEVLDGKVKLNLLNKEVEPNYVKLYLDDVSKLNGLTNIENSILLELVKLSSYENIVFSNKYNRAKICENLNIKDQTVKNAIASFKRKQIIFPVDTGVIRLNPFIFGKGSWKDVKALRLTVEYGENGKTYSLEEVREEDEDNAQSND